MRPRGEIRAALASAAASFGDVGFTWRDAAEHAGVGWDATRMTLENMARAGELGRGGTVAVPGVARPMVRYVSPSSAADPAGCVALDSVVRCWADFK